MGRNGVVHADHARNLNIFPEKQNAQSQIPRFFKIIFGEDCEEVLYLPPQFTPTVKHLVNQQIQIEDSCGQQWPVKLRQEADSSLVFKRGWPKFYLDHDLKEGEFLVFDYMNEGHFIVRIYGKSACERIKFNNGRSSTNKRLRRDPETDFPCEAVQKTSTTLNDKLSPNSAVAPRAESQNSEMLEDINCMINRCEEDHGRDMNILYDLSIFETGNMTKYANKFEEVGHSGDVFIDNFNKDLDTKLVPSKPESMEQSKMTGHGYQISEDNSNVITGSAGEISVIKFKKDSISKASPCAEITGKTETKTEKNSISKASPYAKITGKTKANFDATDMDVVHIDPVNGNSGGNLSGSLCPKTSDSKNLSKGTPDNVFKFLHGCDKIAGKENPLNRRCFTSSMSRSELKNPIGKNSIKKELGESKQEAACCPISSCGNKPNTGGKHGQVLSPVVKIEPDLSSDISPLVSFIPFTAEVKCLSCLVLPEEIPSISRRKERGRLKVVYLTDPSGRMWPVLYPDTYPIVSLTCNWRKFCEGNMIKIGDKCTFQPDNNIMGGCRVDISRNS